jgi:DNA-binding NtrC family response regulator
VAESAGETKGRILVVDDERHQRDILQMILESEGYSAQVAGNGPQAITALHEQPFDLVLTDLKMPGMNGIVLLQEILNAAQGLCVILMTAHGSIGTAVDAMKKGAFDYLTKPLEREQLLIVLRRAMERVRLLRENRLLHEQLRDRFRIENIVGETGAMQDVFRVIQKVAASASPVLIYGESGTGKDLVARALHFASERRMKPLYPVNVPSLPEPLLEAELFGRQPAFPGDSGQTGVIEQAHGSTLFLDEIADLKPDVQAKLLRLLQEREFVRVGGSEPSRADVRLVAATRHDLERAVREGRFREDLFYRLNVAPIVLPPLRQRRTDIPLLAEHFLRRHAESGRPRAVGDAALKALMAYEWPGNVRELQSVIESALLMAETETISRDDLPAHVRAGIAGPRGLLGIEIPDTGIDLESIERALILRALEKAAGSVPRAARLLGLSRVALQNRLEKIQSAPIGAVAARESAESD